MDRARWVLLIAAVIGVGWLLGPSSALAGGPRPDALVAKKAAGPYLSDGAYEIDNGAIQQKVERVIKPGKSGNFFVLIQNDLDNGTVTLTSRAGCFSGSLCVRWFLKPGGDEVTQQIHHQTGYAFPLVAGGEQRFRVHVRVKRHPSLSRYGLHATADGADGTDTVNMRTTVG